MYLVTAEQVHDLCADFSELTASLRQHHCHHRADLKDMLLSSKHGDTEIDDHLLVRAAWSRGDAFGLKAASVFPLNRENSTLPAIHAVYALYDGTTGVPVAVIDGTSMTYYKTAADSALGGLLLANKDTKSMAMIGAGAMAPFLIRAHCELHPTIDQVTIWNRTPATAAKLANTLQIHGVEVVASDDIESTVRSAHLISCATMTKDPLICGQWISPGTHLDLVGAFTLDMREVDDDAIVKSRIFVDSRNTTIGEIGEITIPLEQGLIQESDILGDLYELCPGLVKGRQASDEVTLFKNGGGGHLDLMVAQFIHSKFDRISNPESGSSRQ